MCIEPVPAGIMRVLVKLSTTLRDLVPDYNPAQGIVLTDVPEKCTVAQVAERLNIPEKEIKIIMVNSRQNTLDAELHDNDRLALFPAVGGG